MSPRFGTIPALVDFAAETYKDKPALQIRRGGRFFQISFQELKSRSEKVAGGLVAVGVSPAGRIAILSENRPEWAISYLATLRAGCTAVPLCSQLKTQELRHIMSVVKSEYLFASARHLEQAFEITEGLRFFKGVISLDGESELTLADLIVKGEDAQSLPPMPSPEGLAVLLFTSGTTGKAKGVMLSHKNIVSNVMSTYEGLSYGSVDNLISVLPLYHTFEATCGMLSPLAKGASVTYARSLKSTEIVKDIQDSGATIMLCVPLLYEKLLAGIHRRLKNARVLDRGLFRTAWGISKGLEHLHVRPGKMLFKSLRKRAGLQTLRLMICGGAPLSPEVGLAFRRLGFTFLEGYGLTEASAVVTVDREGKERLGSVGPALPGIDLRIDNPDENGIGEIAVRGDSVMLGYFEDPQGTAKTIRDGWLYTGDLGRLDKHGYLYITGRSKNLIVTKAGKNVYPEEIEEELLKSDFVKEVVVVGRTDPQTKRERIHAMVYPDYEMIDAEGEVKGRAYTKEEVEALIGEEVKKCNEGLADYKKMKEFELREEEFPKTATGKIKRYLFQEKALRL
ncbi:long-chain fatty acid--CoA ligase [candidate division TA06 bacterium]|uniref:Long-chain fatty acid--CoA ligase n=1 Tax=candidate division TA06 bacterium TaxID=2250710 RepID=A0A523UP44_UNCT6|nr:MAG: long-chain fatty acid--CoA ligase [candidate division TA06 bacterium]